MTPADRGERPRRVVGIAALFLLAVSASAQAARVDSIQGSVLNGQQITVTGAGFGATGPTVVLFDDFERGTSGGFIQLNLAQIGSWSGQKNYPKYDGTYKVSGNLAAAISNNSPVDLGSACGNPGAPNCDNSSNWQALMHRFPTPPTRVFWSFWHYVPTGHGFPVESVGDINWKVTWIYGTAACPDCVTNDWFIPVTNEQHHSSNWEMFNVGSNQGFTGSNCSTAMYPMYYVRPQEIGRWMRTQIYIDGSSSCSGTVRLWEIPFASATTGGFGCGSGQNTCQMLRKERLNINTQIEPWRMFSLNGYARTNNSATNHAYMRYDDVYIATGSGALARVELSSHPTWGDTAHGSDLNMTICTPTSWSDRSVQCTVRQGSFAAGQTVYLFVVDSTGAVSDQDAATAGAQGIAVVVGGGSPAEPPQDVENAQRTDVK